MIRVTLKNGSVLLFHEYEYVTTVGWISEDGEYWSDERRHRADELERMVELPGVTRYVVERINELGEAIVEKEWLSPVASVRKFIPAEFA